MAPPAVGTGTLRRLGALDSYGHPVLSVYLDVDGANSPSTARLEAQLEALSVQARAERADVNCLRELLRSMPGLAYGTKGVALFSCAEGSISEAVPLPTAVAAISVVDTIPWIEPLAAMCAGQETP
ncbi:MAG: hypothetical protein ACRDK4_14355 [Solirubrobacteraceae bacterium]